MTGLKLSFRYKLLIFWLGSVLAVLAMVGVVYFYLHTTSIINMSLERIGNSFSILDTEIEARKRSLLANIRGVVSNEGNISALSMIDTYQDIENYQPLIFDLEKQKLASELERRAQATELDLLLAHDSKSALVSFYINDREAGPQGGYLSFRDGVPVPFITMNNEDTYLEREMTQAFQKITAIRHAHKELTADFHGGQRGVIMETFAPVVRRFPDGSSRSVGMIHAAYWFDDRLFQYIATQSGVEFAILLPNGTILGSMDTRPFVDGSSEIPILATQKNGAPFFQRVASDDYILGVTRLPLIDGRNAYFVFGEKKTELTSGIAALEKAVFSVLMLVVLALVPAAAYYMNRTFARPVENLLLGVEGLRNGTYKKLTGFTGSDELSVLARSFNSMSQAIQVREKELLKLSHAVEQSSASIIIADINGNIEYVNAKFIEATGYSAEEVIGRNPRILRSGHTSPEEYRVLWETITAGKEWHGEFHNKRKDGTLYWEYASISPIKAADGTIINFIAIKEDITERKQTEAQLIQSSKLATLGEMATGMAHELNQPLNITRMAAESLLEMTNDDDISTEFLTAKLERILNQIDRASAIINHMRIFGRMDTGETEEVNLKEAVQGAVGLLGEQLRLSEIELSLNLPETCRKVSGHQLQLEQVILNLLTNARDAIMENKGRSQRPQQITIGITDDLQSEEVKLTVQDTGGGVPDTVLGNIFEPFFTTKEVGKGTGLGLSISYGIIAEMGGRIEVANVDDGARFTVALPAINKTSKQAEL